MTFSLEAKSALSAKLSADTVKSRNQGGRQVSYIEGWHCIAEANRIFGFDAWTRETVDIKCVAENPREIGASKLPGFGVTYICKVRVVVDGVAREGCGAGHGIDRDLGQAHESAIKEAETDAMKRALMTFGNPFGLALYDKEKTNVADESDASRARFIAECRSKIGSFQAGDPKLAEWWKSPDQMKARRDFDLDGNEVDLLKSLVIAKMGPAQEAKV